MIMENLRCNRSYFQFSISRCSYILEFPDFKFGTKSQHMSYHGITLHSISTTKMYIPLFLQYVLHLHLKVALKETISSFLHHFIKRNFGHGIGQLFKLSFSLIYCSNEIFHSIPGFALTEKCLDLIHNS